MKRNEYNEQYTVRIIHPCTGKPIRIDCLNKLTGESCSGCPHYADICDGSDEYIHKLNMEERQRLNYDNKGRPSNNNSRVNDGMYNNDGL